MKNKRAKKKEQSPAPGPKAERLKLSGDWQDTVKKSLAKKKPAGGWPK